MVIMMMLLTTIVPLFSCPVYTQLVQRFLAMLFRSSLAFPRKLTEDDKDMMQRLQEVVERLESVTAEAISHALCKLQLLNMYVTKEEPGITTTRPSSTHF